MHRCARTQNVQRDSSCVAPLNVEQVLNEICDNSERKLLDVGARECETPPAFCSTRTEAHHHSFILIALHLL